MYNLQFNSYSNFATKVQIYIHTRKRSAEKTRKNTFFLAQVIFFLYLCALDMLRLLILLFLYTGIVTDQRGVPLPYTTIYSEMHPEIGSATGSDGRFVIDTPDEVYGDFIFSFIGYEKRSINAFEFLTDTISVSPARVVMQEQPIALEEAVVNGKKQRNKRKAMRALLAEVWTQMQTDFTTTPVNYRVVSDVRLDQDSVPWGIEQLIAHTYEMPYARRNGRDSMYFYTLHRKRYLCNGLREKADAFKHSEAIERMDQAGKKHYDLKWTVENVDSGVVVHRSLWNMGNVRYDFQQTMDKLAPWSVSRENENEVVLTHSEKANYLGIFKYTYSRHYILDAASLSVLRFSEQAEFWVKIPFGYKLNADQLEFFNLLNMDEEKVDRLRVRRMHATALLNTMYCTVGGHKYKQERNLIVDATVEGTNRNKPKGERDVIIPIHVKATQRATSIIPNR